MNSKRVVFLLLAALYESWAIPLAVLLVVPFGVLGAVLMTIFRGFSADVYFNVGLITIIGPRMPGQYVVVGVIWATMPRLMESAAAHDAFLSNQQVAAQT